MALYHYVYEITNNINGKKYIGKRSCNVPIEDDTYMGSGKLIKRAINKYGKDNFSKKILEVCDSAETAFEKEKHYIIKYHAKSNPNYYNLAEGGRGANWIKSKTPEDLLAWKRKMSESRKGRIITEEWMAKIIKTRKERGIGVGEKNGMYGKKGKQNPVSKSIIMISQEGIVLQEFACAREAAEFLKIDNMRGNYINKVCIHGGLAYGYFWLFKTDYDKLIANQEYDLWVLNTIKKHQKSIIINRAKIRNNSKKVLQINPLDYSIVAIYETIALASEATKIHSRLISRVCNHGCNKAGGYNWIFYEEYIHMTNEEVVDRFKHKSSDYKVSHDKAKIPVYCLSTNQRFDSAKDAIKYFGMCKNAHIAACCKGKRKSVGKHPITNEPLKWMYYEDFIKQQK